MDLTLKYMELQGTLGYLHKSDPKYAFNYAVAYSREGSVIQYQYYATPEEAEDAVIYWGKTGDFIVEHYSHLTGRHERKIEHPTTVRLVEVVETYRRKMHPPNPLDGEIPW